MHITAATLWRSFCKALTTFRKRLFIRDFFLAMAVFPVTATSNEAFSRAASFVQDEASIASGNLLSDYLATLMPLSLASLNGPKMIPGNQTRISFRVF